jgi:hypothetical protein
MRHALRRAVAATLLLAGGFAAYLALVYVIERPADAVAARELRLALAIYGRVVLVKGLWPQLWIALALAGLLARRFPSRAGTLSGQALLLAAAAGLAGLLVAPTLLPADLPRLPPVVFSGPGNFALTWLEMSAAVAAAAWLPRLAGRTLRRAAAAPRLAGSQRM